MLALVGVERGEEGVLGVALCAPGVSEVLFAGRGEGDEVAAAVGGVALARDQAVGFERVQQRDEDARVHAHGLAELALAQAAVVVQQAEDLELPRLEVMGGVRVAQPAHRLVAEQGQQQAGAGAVLFEHARGGGRGVGGSSHGVFGFPETRRSGFVGRNREYSIHNH